jgi:LysM repeat protein
MKPTLLLTLLPLVFSTAQLHAKSDLEILRARCSEQERQIRELEEENAKLRSLHDLPAKATRSRPSAGVGPTAIAAQSPPQTGSATTYVVRRGDSWDGLAGKFRTKPAALAGLNGMQVTTMIHAGQTLKVPGPTTTTTTTAPAPAPSVAGKTHQAKQGETFYSIGKKYGIPSDTLIAANPEIKPTALRPGQVVRLAKPTSSAAAAVTPATAKAAPTPAAATPQPSLHKPAATTSAATTSAAAAPSPQAQPSRTLPVSTATPAASATGRLPAAPSPVASMAAASSPLPDKTRIKSVMIDGKTTFGEFAAKHGTDIGRLNDLNALDLVETTVLAKGSELYVPAQP